MSFVTMSSHVTVFCSLRLYVKVIRWSLLNKAESFRRNLLSFALPFILPNQNLDRMLEEMWSDRHLMTVTYKNV